MASYVLHGQNAARDRPPFRHRPGDLLSCRWRRRHDPRRLRGLEGDRRTRPAAARATARDAARAGGADSDAGV